tara:strand:+ start:80 stop:799 length:720 start_codon:yes stop_codon:yes gene_type:complete
MNSYDRIYNLLLEYDSNHPIGKFDKKSPLTPQDHGLEGVAPNEVAKRNFRSMKAAIKDAKKQNKDIAYGREGNVKHTRAEKLARAYALRLARGGKKASREIVKAGKTKEKIKGWQGKVKGFNLEDPKHDPDIKGNVSDRLAAKHFGRKTATKAREYAFSGDREKQDDKKAYHQSDWEEHKTHAGAKYTKRPRKPSKWERVQRLQNRLRRRGAAQTARDQQKKGRVVIGTYGSGHWRDED